MTMPVKVSSYEDYLEYQDSVKKMNEAISQELLDALGTAPRGAEMRKKDNWEKRFDEKFRVDEQTRLEGRDIIKHNEDIKSFIKQELEKAIHCTKCGERINTSEDSLCGRCA